MENVEAWINCDNFINARLIRSMIFTLGVDAEECGEILKVEYVSCVIHTLNGSLSSRYDLNTSFEMNAHIISFTRGTSTCNSQELM